MKRVAQNAAWCAAALIASWIAFRVAGIEVGAGPFFLYCIVVFATGFAIDFLERRTADARTAAAVVAAGTTIIFWAAVRTANLEIENVHYVVLFASMFALHFVGLRRRRRRAGAPQTRETGTEYDVADGCKARSNSMTCPSRSPGLATRIGQGSDASSASNAAPHGRGAEDMIVMTEHGCVFPGDRRDDARDAHLSRRMAATARMAHALHDVLSAAAAGAAPAPGSPFDPAVLAGRTAGAALDALVEAVGPAGDGPGAEASRRAVRDAVSGLLERFPDADLFDLSEEQLHLVVEDFVANDTRNCF